MILAGTERSGGSQGRLLVHQRNMVWCHRIRMERSRDRAMSLLGMRGVLPIISLTSCTIKRNGAPVGEGVNQNKMR